MSKEPQFMALINGLLSSQKHRFSLEDVKKNAWFRESLPSHDDIVNYMLPLFESLFGQKTKSSSKHQKSDSNEANSSQTTQEDDIPDVLKYYVDLENYSKKFNIKELE